MDIKFIHKLGFLFEEPSRWKVLYGGRGAGKCLAIGTQVIMADGSLRAVENIWPGESVMGPDSKPRKVLGTTRGKDTMFRIKQSKGITYVVNSAHILSLKNFETNEILNINVQTAYNNYKEWYRGWKFNNDELSEIFIEEIGEGEYAGFSLDGDHLFLLADGTVTHNTEGCAIALIIFSRTKRLRIACFREFQKSITDSVYSIIKQKIYDLGYQDEFKITNTTIVHLKTGSEFIFLGLRYNIDSIKSLAFIDIAWVEEAKNVSKRSWKILGPTIRGRPVDDPNGRGGPFGLGPEIWVTFNPELDDDETYKMFVLKPPSEFDHKGRRYSIIKKINWQDNPWFPDDLRAEMEESRAKSMDEYLEVWQGNTKKVLEGAIFAEELRKAISEGRIGKVKYDPTKPVNTFWDLGHSDKTAIWFGQTIGVEFNFINYYENSLQKMPHYIKFIQDTGYIFGTHYLPHDGDAETLSNITPKKQLTDVGYKVKIVERPKKKFVGINASRTVFDLCNFDEENCADGLTCLRRYCYEVNEETGSFSKEPEHDTPWSHGADGFQTFALSLKSETASKKPKRKELILSIRSNQTGWMGV